MIEKSKSAYELFMEITRSLQTMTIEDYENKFSDACSLLEEALKMEEELQDSTEITVSVITAVSYIRKAEAARDLCMEIPNVYSFCGYMIQNLSGECSCDGGCGCHEE